MKDESHNIGSAPINLLNDIDKKIPSASISGVDITGVEEDERRSRLSVDWISAMHVLQRASAAQQGSAREQARVDRSPAGKSRKRSSTSNSAALCTSSRFSRAGTSCLSILGLPDPGSYLA